MVSRSFRRWPFSAFLLDMENGRIDSAHDYDAGATRSRGAGSPGAMSPCMWFWR